MTKELIYMIEEMGVCYMNKLAASTELKKRTKNQNPTAHFTHLFLLQKVTFTN